MSRRARVTAKSLKEVFKSCEFDPKDDFSLQSTLEANDMSGNFCFLRAKELLTFKANDSDVRLAIKMLVLHLHEKKRQDDKEVPF